MNPAYPIFRQQPVPSAAELAALQQQQSANSAAAEANATVSATISPTAPTHSGTSETPFGPSVTSSEATPQPQPQPNGQSEGHVNGNAQGGLTKPPYGAIIPDMIQGPREILSTKRQNELELGQQQALQDRLKAITSGRPDTYGL
jgi:hypothetical protein